MYLNLEEDLNLYRNKDGKYVIDDKYVEEEFERIASEIVNENKNANYSFVLEGLCGIDISKYDMSGLSLENFRRLTFDSETKFSQEQINKFHPQELIEQGKKFPGIESFHKEGINGEGTTVVMLDSCFDSSKEEYKNRVIKHIVIEKENSEVKCRDYDKEKDIDDFHGKTTASLVAGRECGVAPNAKMILFGVNGNSWSEDERGNAWKESKEAMLKHIKQEIENGNMKIPDIISISADLETSNEAKAILKELEENGCIVIDSSKFWDNFRWGRKNDAGKAVLQDELTKTIFDDGKEYDKDSRAGKLKENKYIALVPCTGKTSFAKTGKDGKPVYKYNGSFCGASFAIPQIAGLFLLARQIDKYIKFEEFIEIIKNPERLNPEGMMYLDAKTIIEEIYEKSKTKGEYSKGIKDTQELGAETLPEQEETGEKSTVEKGMEQHIKDLENKKDKTQKGN